MPPADFWDDEEEIRFHDRYVSGARHVPRPRIRVREWDDYGRRSDLLTPEHHTTGSLHRTRSVGHAPAPNVTIYNTTTLDNESNPHVRTDPKVRSSAEQASPLPSPRGRTSRIADEWRLENDLEDLAAMRLEIARARSRSRSAHHHYRDESPHHHHVHGKPDLHEHDAHLEEKWRRELAEERLREQADRERHEKEEELIRRRLELKHLKDSRQRIEEEERIKREEERLKRDIKYEMERRERERDEEEERRKREEDRIKKEYEYKMEKKERERLENTKKAEEERRRIVLEEQRKAAEKEREEKEERQRILQEEEIRRNKAEKAAAEEKKRIEALIAENARKAEEAAKKAEAERQAAVDAYNKKKAEEAAKAKAETERVIAEYERNKVLDAEKEKRARAELLMKMKLEEEERQRKEKEEEERFMERQRKKAAEEKAKKEKKEKEVEEEMRKRLAVFGFQENQIQAMIKAEEAQHQAPPPPLQQGLTPKNPLPRLTGVHQPTYVKVHKQHLAIDTLVYYNIPYEIDSLDPNYIIILREMEPNETEILFEHTRRLRTRTTSSLLIEERRSERHSRPEYAWVRRRNPSRSPSMSRRRSSPKRNVGLREMFF